MKKTGKVKVDFKNGTSAEVYPDEKYRLIKKGLLKIDKKEQSEYDEKFKAEKKIELPKIIKGSQFDRMNGRIEALENEIIELKIKIEELTPKKDK